MVALDGKSTEIEMPMSGKALERGVEMTENPESLDKVICYNNLWKLLIDKGMNKGDLKRISGVSTMSNSALRNPASNICNSTSFLPILTFSPVGFKLKCIGAGLPPDTFSLPASIAK
jgi:hypothetical protein